MIEAIEVNFDGALDEIKVEKDDVGRYIHVQKEHEVKHDKRGEGDRKAVRDKINIRIRIIQRL